MEGALRRILILIMLILLALAAVAIFKNLQIHEQAESSFSSGAGQESSAQTEKVESTKEGEEFLENALKHTGGYYKSAGKHLKDPENPEDENSIDCTGLVQELFKKYKGIDLPGGKHTRMVDALRELGAKEVESLDDLYVGDLIFYRSDQENNGQHVAIYAGNGEVLDASPGREGRDGVYVRSLTDSEPYCIMRILKDEK